MFLVDFFMIASSSCPNTQNWKQKTARKSFEAEVPTENSHEIFKLQIKLQGKWQVLQY
jgi:hypothetical protein